MDLEIEKEVSKDCREAPDENATASTHKKHSKPKKRDSTFLYGNEVAEILKSSNTSEQKLTTVCNKYSEMLHANRKLMVAYKTAESRITKMQQENDQCQQQRSKAVLARSRLENLCRELQKLNKAQKEEIDLKLRLEEEKRREISATFQNAFAEMNTLTSQNTEKNTKMREENLEMREKIKSVRERIELSEEQLEKVQQQGQLELQLAEARMAKVKMEMTAEKETLLKEKQQLLLKLTEYQVRIQEMQATEVALRSQISMYTEKYDDFQNALTKSNEVFSGFNEEMEKMSKKIVKLEKETSLWKQRWEKSHTALLDMAAEKQTRDAEMSKVTHKLSLLQGLCKAFQRERSELLSQLRAQAPAAATSDGKSNKVDIQQVEELSKDCQELKDNFVQLQGSLAEVFESEVEGIPQSQKVSENEGLSKPELSEAEEVSAPEKLSELPEPAKLSKPEHLSEPKKLTELAKLSEAKQSSKPDKLSESKKSSEPEKLTEPQKSSGLEKLSNLKTESLDVTNPQCESNSDQQVSKIVSNTKVSDANPDNAKTSSTIAADSNQSANTVTEPSSNARIVTEETTDNRAECPNKCENRSLEKNVPLSKSPMEAEEVEKTGKNIVASNELIQDLGKDNVGT